MSVLSLFVIFDASHTGLNRMHYLIKNILKQMSKLAIAVLINRTKLVEQHRDMASNQHINTLKQKIMKLRKENEILKRKVLDSKEG